METSLPHSDTAVAERYASVSGELTDLLIELAYGLRRACVYGPNNPAVLEAATSFVTRFSGRRGDRGTLAIAVAGSHLIVEVRPVVMLTRRFSGVTTGLEHPLLGALADRLAQHEVGEIVLAEGVTPKEIASILGFLSTDPARTGRPLGQEEDEALSAIPNIRIHRDATPRETAVDGDTPPDDPEHDARLWSALARAALGIPEEDDDEDRTYEPSEVATAIAARAGNPSFDRRIAAQVLAVSSNLGKSGPLESIDLARQFSDMLRRLDRPTLKVLLAMSGDARLRQEFLRDAASSLDVDVVFELVHSAGEDENSDISRWMLRLLSKLARHAQTEDGPVAHRSDAALREQITTLLSGWQLDNPNPEDYEEALARLSSISGEGPESETARSRVDGIRTLAVALEVGVDGPAVRQAIDEMIATGRIGEMAVHLDEAPNPKLAESLWTRLADRTVLYRLIEEEEPDWEVIDLVLPHAGMEAAEPLLDRLAEADSLTIRRRLFDRLIGLGSEVGKPAVRCLGQPDATPWYVLRNVLSLLAMLETWPDGFNPWDLTDTRASAIVRAMEDENTRIAALGVVEAESGCPPEAEPLLVSIALSEEGALTEFRTHSIRALTRLESPAALEALLEIAAPRRRGLRRVLPEESPELLAALRGLSSGWPSDPRAQEALSAARASASVKIREAAS
jgi:hypothetical protein